MRSTARCDSANSWMQPSRNSGGSRLWPRVRSAQGMCSARRSTQSAGFWIKTGVGCALLLALQRAMRPALWHVSLGSQPLKQHPPAGLPPRTAADSTATGLAARGRAESLGGQPAQHQSRQSSPPHRSAWSQPGSTQVWSGISRLHSSALLLGSLPQQTSLRPGFRTAATHITDSRYFSQL